MSDKQLTAEQVALLKKPLPPEAVSPHPTKAYLSSIKAIYVVERLNDVFGIGTWRIKNEVIEHDSKMVVVKSTLTVPAYDIEIESFGGNDNADKGDAYKGASTDALTKICSYLGIGMDVFKGLADKGKRAPRKQADQPHPEEDMPSLNYPTIEYKGACKKCGLEGLCIELPKVTAYGAKYRLNCECGQVNWLTPQEATQVLSETK